MYKHKQMNGLPPYVTISEQTSLCPYQKKGAAPHTRPSCGMTTTQDIRDFFMLRGSYELWIGDRFVNHLRGHGADGLKNGPKIFFIISTGGSNIFFFRFAPRGP